MSAPSPDATTRRLHARRRRRAVVRLTVVAAAVTACVASCSGPQHSSLGVSVASTRAPQSVQAPSSQPPTTRVPAIPWGVPAQTTTVTTSLERAFLLHSLGPTGRPRPLVIALHSAGHTAADMAALSGLPAYADAHGFDVAFGSGVEKTWNAGGCCGSTADDLAYLQAVVDSVAAITPIDRRRVYVIGLSNGGMMAYRAACELPGTFAAAGVVAGALLRDVDCRHTTVRVALIHGAADATVPIGGGTGYHGYDFPAQSTDVDRVGPGSVLTTHEWGGGHAYPDWATAELWSWLSQWRLGD